MGKPSVFLMKLFRKSSNGHAERSEASCSHRQGRSTMRARCFAALCMTAQTPFVDFLNSFTTKAPALRSAGAFQF